MASHGDAVNREEAARWLARKLDYERATEAEVAGALLALTAQPAEVETACPLCGWPKPNVVGHCLKHGNITDPSVPTRGGNGDSPNETPGQPRPGPSATTYYLIERGQAVNHAPTVWWCGPGPHDYTEDAHHAVKFGERGEAQRTLDKQGLHFTNCARVTEHVFLPGPSTPTCATCGYGCHKGQERRLRDVLVCRACACPSCRPATKGGFEEALDDYLRAEHELSLQFSLDGMDQGGPLKFKAKAKRTALFAAHAAAVEAAREDARAYRQAVMECFPMDSKWTHVASASDVYTIKRAGDEAVEAERERCARVADEYARDAYEEVENVASFAASDVAAAIRGGGK